jgi:hypothetical protein
MKNKYPTNPSYISVKKTNPSMLTPSYYPVPENTGELDPYEFVSSLPDMDENSAMQSSEWNAIMGALKGLMAERQPRPDPIVECQYCAQPTLYDRRCRGCGAPPIPIDNHNPAYPTPQYYQNKGVNL